MVDAHLQQGVLGVCITVAHAGGHSAGVQVDSPGLDVRACAVAELAIGHGAVLRVARCKLPPQPGLMPVRRQLGNAELALVLYDHLVPATVGC